MYQPQHPPTDDSREHGPVFQTPRIALLDENHWLHIQKRYRMSPRELQIAKLICQGLNNEQIAGNLKIKHGTVKTHVRNIYRRIRVRNKITMLLKFIENAIKFSAKSGITPPIPILNDIEKLERSVSASLGTSPSE